MTSFYYEIKNGTSRILIYHTYRKLVRPTYSPCRVISTIKVFKVLTDFANSHIFRPVRPVVIMRPGSRPIIGCVIFPSCSSPIWPSGCCPFVVCISCIFFDWPVILMIFRSLPLILFGCFVVFFVIVPVISFCGGGGLIPVIPRNKIFICR